MGQKLEAVVELDKDDYLVLSFPERAGVIGFAATSDLNLQSQRTFSLGQKLQATVVALPIDSTGAVSLAKECHSERNESDRSSHDACVPSRLMRTLQLVV